MTFSLLLLVHSTFMILCSRIIIFILAYTLGCPSIMPSTLGTLVIARLSRVK